MQADYDKELQSYFTDVEHLREMFKQWLAAPTLPKRMLVIHGVGGVGKSSLLRMFRLHCKSVNVPVALASGDEAKSALEVLTRWADDLKADGIALPAFGKTFQQYRAIQAKVESEAAKMAEKLAKGATKTIIETAASTIPGIGPLVGKLGGMGAEALVDWLRGFLTKPDVDLLLDPAKKLTDDFLADLTQAASKRRIVLLLDTYEQMTALEDWVREVAQRLSANVLFVIAGRALPNWGRAWSGWMANAQVEELKPMSEDDMRELIRRYYATMRGGEPDPKQVEAIIRFARGLPMVVTSAVQLWVKYGVEDFEAVKPEIVANLVDRLMEGVPKELVPALEAAAVVRWFDQPILRAVMKQDDVREVYDELRRFPFVRTRVEGLALHDAVREMIDENLRAHDSERHCELHERAAAYFEKRLEKATGEEAERFQLERLYHRIRADEETGIRLFQEMAENLARYRLLGRLRNLLKEMHTYPLTKFELWRRYYHARMLHLESRLQEAEQMYEEIWNTSTEPKLRAYAGCDWAEILLTNWNEQAVPRARNLATQSLSIYAEDDSHLCQNHFILAICDLYENKKDLFNHLDRAFDFFERTNDVYGIVSVIVEKKRAQANFGLWKEFVQTHEDGEHYLAKFPQQSPWLKAKLKGEWARAWALIGRIAESEYLAREAWEIGRNLELHSVCAKFLHDLGWALGFQNRFEDAERCYREAMQIAKDSGERYDFRQAIVFALWGVVKIREGKLDVAEEHLQNAILLRERLKDFTPRAWLELFVWLGYLYELKRDWQWATSLYNRRAYWSNVSYYFECAALTGLIRVKHAQRDYAAIPPLLAEAEQLAQQYEYNDHLASLRLTQGHIAWEGNAPAWENGFDAALYYYQHALIYALRYNRFLLDEVLSGRPQGTPLRPIIPYCLQRGEEGRRMLIALRDWWQTGFNDIGTPRPDTISLIPEGIPLLEAERIAREREPGDGSPQKSVVQQIADALRDM